MSLKREDELHRQIMNRDKKLISLERKYITVLEEVKQLRLERKDVVKDYKNLLKAYQKSLIKIAELQDQLDQKSYPQCR